MIQAIRINHHSEQKTPLLESLIPVMREIASFDGVTAVWPQRHWLFGPHILLLISSDTPLPDVEIDRAASLAEAALSRARSMTPVDAARWSEISDTLGRLELIPGPYEPIRSDNTVERDAPRVTDSFLRDEASVIERGRMILHGVETIRRDGDASTVLAGMATLASSYHEGGLAKGYLAFLSHWKEFFHWHDPRGVVERSLAASFTRQRTQIIEIVRAARDAAEGFPATSHHQVDSWWRWVQTGRPGAMRLAETGQVLPYPHDSRRSIAASMAPELAVQWGGGDDRSYSDFHTQFRKLDFTRLGDGRHFSAYRFQVNTMFELLSLYGVAPSERYGLAYLMTRGAEELGETTWSESVEASIRRQRNDPTAVPTLPWAGAR